MGFMANIGGWTEDRLNNWMAHQFGLQGNVRQLINRAVADATVPSGNVEFTAGSAAPAGYLLCDGASYLRVDYPNLFSVIGTVYGAADAAHFNVPDVAGRTIVMQGAHADVDTIGDSDGVASASRTPVHKHHQAAFNTGTHIDSYLGGPVGTHDGPGAFEVTNWTYYSEHVHQVPAFDTPTATVPYLVLLAIIKT